MVITTRQAIRHNKRFRRWRHHKLNGIIEVKNRDAGLGMASKKQIPVKIDTVYRIGKPLTRTHANGDKYQVVALKKARMSGFERVYNWAATGYM